MDKIPSMWRTELWHALSVHFPIVLLLFATLVAVVELFIKNDTQRLFLNYTKSWLLGLGILSSWVVIYTGSLAYNVEVRKLCDPGVLQDHQYWGYVTAIIYTAVGFVETLFYLKVLTKTKILQIALVIILFTGSSTLFYVGHLGASLVYQQGAATYQPSEDCHEFE